MHCCQMFLYMGQVVDKLGTKGRTFVWTFIPEAGRFHGAGKELLPYANWNISNQIPINFQRCSKVADVFVYSKQQSG